MGNGNGRRRRAKRLAAKAHRQWFRRRAEISELDKLIGPTVSPGNNVPLSPGAAQHLAKLREIRSLAEDGFELWWFRGPQEDWDQLMGYAGFSIELDGEVLDRIITMLN